MKIEIDTEYKIIATDPLFTDFFGLTAICKRVNPNGLFEMHVNGTYIFCNENQIRKIPQRKSHRKLDRNK